ncbi:nuclear transport factor 2 family protein [Roseomonas nepalensis]|uniref:Nuclear transport factor 2 family protein n=1 Tax=Muricoccus nepalensis TaxID=1854500 RepID=A0A502GBM2_9PROT|nr:nuclear transport factor 2 family protein [Roseomonas nepalensis]TPG59667.1 nuclear transport factor 2 family protein [Roseomonas nepalensis]
MSGAFPIGAHPGRPGSAAEEADRAAIRRLIEAWGFARDSGDWDALAATFQPDGRIAVSWFDGPFADFVETLRARRGAAFSKHVMCGSRAALDGDRALVETDVLLGMRGPVDGAEMIGQTTMRFLDRVERRGDGAWRVLRRDAIYDHDWMVPALPGGVAPAPDAGDAPGHRFLAWRLRRAGRTVPADLPGPGSEGEAALRAGGRAWLEAGG